MEVSGDNVAQSLPSNYVTINDLKQRWLQRQQQKPSSNTRLNPKPIENENENEKDAATKISNDVVSRSRKELKSPPTPEVEVKVLDDSKTLIRVSTNKKDNGHNHQNEEHSQQQQQQQQQTSINNNKQSWNKNSSRAPRNPRFIINKNPTGETAKPQPEVESEPVEEMKKKRKKKKKQYRNRDANEVGESNDQMAPIVADENVNEEIKQQQQPVLPGERHNRNWNRQPVLPGERHNRNCRNRNRNQKEVGESKDKKTSVAVYQNVDERVKQQPVHSIGRDNRNWNRKEVRESKHKTTLVGIDENVLNEVVVDQNVDEEKKQQPVHAIGRHNRNWNRKEVRESEVRESKHKPTPVVIDQNVVDEVVVVAAAATVKEINVTEGNNGYRRGGSSSGSGNGRLQGSKYGQWKLPYRENTKGNMSQMWVRKGESVPN